jgi:predicted dehydrogenase
MTHRPNRRDFLRTASTLAAAGAVGVWGQSPRAFSRSPNEKLNLAFVGVSNKGGHNIGELASQNVYALCDVDSNFLGQAGDKYKDAKKYDDFRKMLDAEEKNLDGVVVSTPDHTHAPATSRALVMGKPVYCEKPLTHTVHEARVIAELAKKQKVATQMGTQIHAGDNYRRVVELVQSGAVGRVNEVFCWCNKGWSNGRIGPERPVPKNLDWDLWLGPAKERPYFEARPPQMKGGYAIESVHPFFWRRFWEYGSGTFGDMACHVMDLPFWALKLRYPKTVQAQGPEVHPDGAPAYCLCDYEFPREGEEEPLKLHWSDGGRHHGLVAKTNDHDGQPLSKWGLGTLFVGDKGMLVADYGRHQLLPKDKFTGFQPPAQSIPRSEGHWNEWVKAIKTGSPTTCNFDYSGALTEAVLLGVVAFRTGKRLEWDAAKLAATNCSEAERFIRKEYRKGFELAKLA